MTTTNYPGFDASKSYIGTCQCCFATQVVNDGHLVLHGYRRPGDGYVHAECPGQRFAPFELSCEVAKSHLEFTLNDRIPNLSVRIANLAADKVETLVIQVPDGYYYSGRSRYGTAAGVKYKFVEIARGYVHAKTSENDYRLRGQTFDDFRKGALKEAQASLVEAKEYAERLRRLIASWKYAPEALKTREAVAAADKDAKAARASALLFKRNWKDLWKGVADAIRDHKDGFDWQAKDKEAFKLLPAFPNNKQRAAARKR